ncbi:hypothetical protein [Flavobacterium reichenbachii]|uniref:Uncharacterized protein n=1 Tax=Flavobacterium reichenbachii TaxID=362418 RepID=A0A085ZG01_9FLAO|nr:hypothetical protein [Flavobacterium reichenbachii]KFF03365.1 hypothetical protein IW19_20980 [Flavobacterium reichenbachii]OXB16731.1 hypothetical protein B0A68_06270 [Flavobacterium reichenbachii]
MKNYFLLITFLFCSSIIAQNSLLLPPENVQMAFKNKYPSKIPIWSIEYSNNQKEEVEFEAQFAETSGIKACAVYDQSGAFKAYKVPIQLNKLPKKVQIYLKKNYTLKFIKEILNVLDDKNASSYSVSLRKNAKLYRLIFDANGDYKDRTRLI